MNSLVSRLLLLFVLCTPSALAQRGAPIEQLTFTPYHASGIYDVGETVGWTVNAGPGHAHVRLQVDDPAKQRGGAQRRQARSLLPAGHDRNHGRPAGDDLRRGRSLRQARRRTPSAPPRLRRVSSAATPAATTDSTPSARPSRRRRSGSRRPARPTSTHSGTRKLAAQAKVPINAVLTPVETDVPDVELKHVRAGRARLQSSRLRRQARQGRQVPRPDPTPVRRRVRA